MENTKEQIATLIVSSPFWSGTKDVAELCKKPIEELQNTLTSLEIREAVHADTLYGN